MFELTHKIQVKPGVIYGKLLLWSYFTDTKFRNRAQRLASEAGTTILSTSMQDISFAYSLQRMGKSQWTRCFGGGESRFSQKPPRCSDARPDSLGTTRSRCCTHMVQHRTVLHRRGAFGGDRPGMFMIGELSQALCAWICMLTVVIQDTQKLAALQFAAKLHELLMLASISTAMFGYIREQMAFGEGVTIGTLFAGQQFSSINNLWSMEFWSAVYDIQGGGRKKPKYYIVVLIALATILGVSVGPSGAVLMRPRLDWWPSGGTIFWLNATQDALYNKQVNAEGVPKSCYQYTGDMACPYGGFESLVEQHAMFWPQVRPMGMMPESIWIQSTRSLRELKAYQRTSWDSNSTIWKNRLTHVKVPFASIADAISETVPLWSYAAANSPRGKRFRFRKDVSFSVDDFQPYVEAFCTPNRLVSSDGNEVINFSFANTASSPMTEVEDESFGRMKVYPETVSVRSNAEDSFWLKNALFNSSVGSIKWLDRTGPLDSTNSSLLAVVALPQKRTRNAGFFACTIKSSLQPSTSQGARSGPMLIKSLDRQDIGNIDIMKDHEKVKLREAIWPSAAWAAYTNPYLPSRDMDVFAHMLDAAGLSETKSKVWPINTPYTIESIISLMVANGLSRMPYNTTTVGRLQGREDPENNWYGGSWADQLLPQQGLGFGGHAYEILSEEEASATRFQMKARSVHASTCYDDTDASIPNTNSN